jgi:hypothetical protein
MCIKIGGWMRVEASWGNTNGSMTWGPYNGQENNRATNNMVTRSRGYITADAREQTAYGTARAYIDVGISNSNTGTDGASNTFSSNRAFLQWAGFTAGLTQSFYDFYSAPAVAYRAAYFPIEDTGDGGWWLWAYTAQLGNGVSATVSAEQRRTISILDSNIVGAAGLIPGASGNTTGYGGMQVPDVVANLRVDQTWGSAQIMGAVHQVNPTYYGATAALGHPSDTFGWVVGGGMRLNFPMVAQGDFFQGEVNYTQGALRYLNDTNSGNFGASMGNNEVFGVESDCVFGGTIAGGSTTSCNLTTAWSLNAAYEHFWTPSVHQSFVGSYYAVSYNNQANAMLCSTGGFGAGIGSLAVATPGCNMNWDMYGVSTRLQWDVTKTFYLGVEVLYDHMDSAQTGSATGALGGFALGAPNAPTILSSSMNTWAGTVRMHKDFLP